MLPIILHLQFRPRYSKWCHSFVWLFAGAVFRQYRYCHALEMWQHCMHRVSNCPDVYASVKVKWHNVYAGFRGFDPNVYIEKYHVLLSAWRDYCIVLLLYRYRVSYVKYVPQTIVAFSEQMSQCHLGSCVNFPSACSGVSLMWEQQIVCGWSGLGSRWTDRGLSRWKGFTAVVPANFSLQWLMCRLTQRMLMPATAAAGKHA